MIDIEQSRLCAFQQDRIAASRSLVEKMTRVAKEWRQAFHHRRGLVKDRIRVEWLSTIRNDDSISVFQVAFDARTKYFGNQSVRDANPSAARFIFISRANAAQRSSHALVTETFFAGVIQRAVIRQYQVRSRADLNAIGRDADALRDEPIGFFKKGLRIDHHAVAQHAGLAHVNDAGRQQMQHEGLIADLDRMSGIVAALIADHDVETLGEQIDNLALAFIAPLGPDNRDNHSQISEVRDQKSEEKTDPESGKHTKGAVTPTKQNRAHNLIA